jgi:hypothetical protein
MLAIHRIFQMIFGIIVSVTVLYFLISYSAQYQHGQQNMQRADILQVFAEDARQVYLTGIPVNFTYFSKYSDLSTCYITASGKSVPQIDCLGADAPKIAVDTPVLFSPGIQVYLSRDTLDYGWWKFNAVEAVPDTVFIFNPVGGEDEWSVMRTIVENLPDTNDSLVKIEFTLCNGNVIEKPCGNGNYCGWNDFLSAIRQPSAYGRCTAKLGKGMRLVTVSKSCTSTFPEKDACIVPPPDPNHYVGNAYIQGSNKVYVWKDPLDLVALSMGGSDKDEFGKTLGDKIYTYKNVVLVERLSLASQIMSTRLKLITKGMLGNDETGCRDVYAQLFQILDGVPALNDYLDVVQMNDLDGKLNQAKELYVQLEERGCERSGYGA